MPKRLSDEKRAMILSRLQQDIDAANAYYEKEVEPRIIERYAVYHADQAFYKKMFPRLSRRCEITSTDVQDIIESAMPALMKTFFGSTDVVTIQGADGGDEDEARAKKMQALINYELRKNRFFMTFYQWAKDALITNLGIIKVDWERETQMERRQIAMNAEAYGQLRAQTDAAGIRVLQVEPDNEAGGVVVTYEAPVLTKNQPRVMNVMASEFRFSPDATSLDTCDFIAHRKIVSLDYLRKQEQEGLYAHVAELAERAKAPDYTTLDKENHEEIDEEVNASDSGRRKVELYECYVNLNMSDDADGALVPMIVTVSNGVILRMEENTYERHPFFTLSPRLDPHRIWPETGFVDLVAQLQHAKTAIIRQMIYNIALGNDSKQGIDMTKLADINDLIENRQFIRVNGNVGEAIQQIPTPPLAPWTFNMLEYLDTSKENRTGITRYNQGLDSNSLNKTATGINIITQQANQRLELIARIFAETGLRDLFKFLIKMNQLFINEETVIRLTNGPMQIVPDDLEGDFDLEVNAGMGAGAKQTNLQNLQMVQALLTQLFPLGLVGVEQVYNFARRMIEEIGFKNVDDFLVPPGNVQVPQGEEKQDASESLRASITDAPWQVQMQWWQKQGFEVTPEMFAEQAAQHALAGALDAETRAGASRTGGMPGGGRGYAAPDGGERARGTGTGSGARPAFRGNASDGAQGDGAGAMPG